MQKMLAIDPEKCTGCRLCEITCSIHNEKTCTPERSRIRVTKWENEGIYIPMVCQQCDVPICETVCPMHAVKRDTETQALVIDNELCVGCRLCVQFCPFGSIGVDDRTKKVIKCNLCNGEPVCVKFCEPAALQYVDANTLNTRKRRAAAEKFSDILKKTLARF
ncbi:MAG: 4Fe-4S dicluster domain-containing protein [Candidatus Bathyarchaeota archaeon]|nr:MAG: 4Fe-4S dicluster domain-containing protein [Candidatus Bathyarchaeota archaeon]